MVDTSIPTPEPANESKRPAHLAHGRWLGDLEDEAPLSDAETALIVACAKGKPWWPNGWDGKTRPNTATLFNTIRATLIRFLILGGDANHPVHENGVMAGGAWVSGVLDVSQAHCPARLLLRHCHLVGAPSMMAATLPELALIDCALPGLQAERLIVTGGMYLKEGFTAGGEVRLLGAQIGDNLCCNGGTFTNVSGNAINADGLRVKGDLYLSDQFNAIGKVRLLGVEIGGVMSCIDGKFSNFNGHAISADGLKVRDGLFLRNARIESGISLSSAHIGTLIDDISCWQAGGHIFDGLNYDRIIGTTDAASRIAWLKKQHPPHLTSDFRPQPWEQVIKTLREMGHPYEAGEVAIAKQVQMRKAGVIRGGVRSAMHWLYGKLAGYGYRPIWTVYWMIAVGLFCGACFEIGREWGYFGPTSPLIHASAALEICGGAGEGKPFWTSVGCPVPPEYTTMWPWLYSLDLLLPLVDLQQDVDWAPIVINGNGEQLLGGYLLRGLLWFEILFGWAASLILVAVLGRLVDKD